MVAEETLARIVVLAGPTATGKTEAAMELCRLFGGDIVSADSMQIYRHMDIGTAKPTREEQERVRHHLIDVVEPDEPFSAARYAEKASERITMLFRAGRAIFLVGGTGLYMEALLGGLIQGPPAHPEFRRQCRRQAELRGEDYLHGLLRERDPLAAERIHPRDAVRIIRALEVLQYTGFSIVSHQQRHGFTGARYEYIKIGLMMEREELYRRINDRVESMMTRGLLEETEQLLARGYDPSCPSMQSFCYRHMVQVLEGILPLDEAIRRIKRDTRNYAKRQIAWFKRDRRLQWLEPGNMESIVAAVSGFMSTPRRK